MADYLQLANVLNTVKYYFHTFINTLINRLRLDILIPKIFTKILFNCINYVSSRFTSLLVTQRTLCVTSVEMMPLWDFYLYDFFCKKTQRWFYD